MHTTASDGTMSPQALVNEVWLLRRTRPQLRVIAVTDHDTVSGAYTAERYLQEYFGSGELEIVPGAEISSSDGHIVALNIRRNIPKGMDAASTIQAIHDEGGLAIAAHPYAYLPFLKGLKGIKGLIAHPEVGRGVDAVEIRNANPTETLNNHFTRWVNRRNLKRPEVGGSDSHFRSAIARAVTSFPGNTAGDLMEAIRAGTTRAVGAVYGPVALYEYVRDRLAWKDFCREDPIARVFHEW